MLFLEDRAQGAADADALRELCLECGTDPVFLTGNHDPTVSGEHHLELAGGAIFVTHGDILFHGISPWGIEAGLLSKAHTREIAAMGHPADLTQRLKAVRRATLAIEHMGAKFNVAKPGLLHLVRHHLWPPWRPLHILSGWARAPFLANALAARHAPQARFVILGHTHFSGVWRIGKRIIINTGGFLPLSRRFAVDLSDSQLSVREIVSGNGRLRLGPEVARYGLD